MAYISFIPKDYFKTYGYTGDNTSDQAQTIGFQPDISWIKQRNSSEAWVIYDSVRGATKTLFTNATSVESTLSTGLKSFDANGFTVGNNGVTGASNTYMSWNWKAGTTSGITTNGSTTITPSSYSFDPTRGVAILKYTGNSTAGAKLAHGLGKKPDFWFIKGIDYGSDGWDTYHRGMDDYTPQNHNQLLHTDAGRVTYTNRWNDTAADDVNITLGTSDGVNDSSYTYVAYVFCSITGFSKHGGYLGNNNNSNNNAFVYCGFRPSVVTIKRAETDVYQWCTWDIVRNPTNICDEVLHLDNDAASSAPANLEIEILSNGFKILKNHSYYGAGTTRYMFSAWADYPLVSSSNIPVVGR